MNVKCCNCGGECAVRVKRVEVSRIVAVQQMSYVEAVKRVEGERGHSSEEDMAVDACNQLQIICQSSDLDRGATFTCMCELQNQTFV